MKGLPIPTENASRSPSSLGLLAGREQRNFSFSLSLSLFFLLFFLKKSEKNLKVSREPFYSRRRYFIISYKLATIKKEKIKDKKGGEKLVHFSRECSGLDGFGAY